MLILLLSFVAVLLGFYLIILGLLRKSLDRMVRNSVPEHKAPDPLSVSIVVSARNEAQNLRRLVSCLTQQSYPSEKLDIVIVDDRSEDDSWKILTDEASRNRLLRPLRVTDLLPGFAPKKRALDLGIRSAQGEIILLTDADCTPPETWVRSMVEFYRPDVSVVLGYSPYRFDRPLPRILEGMLRLDYFSLNAVAAAGIGWGHPLTASGTNLSYRKQTFIDASGFESFKQWISGDDDLFVHKVANERIGNFAFALDPGAYVPAAAPNKWRQFWHQRIRFASKGRHYDYRMVAGLIAVYVLNLSLIAGLVGSFFLGVDVALTVAGVWVVKSMAEFLFLSKAASLFGEGAQLKYFVPTAFLHPFYVTLFGLLGLFGGYEWKGERFKKRMDEHVEHVDST